MVDINPVTIVANGKYFSIKKLKPKKGSRRFYDEPSYLAFEASSYDKGNNNEDMERRKLGWDSILVVFQGGRGLNRLFYL